MRFVHMDLSGLMIAPNVPGFQLTFAEAFPYFWDSPGDAKPAYSFSTKYGYVYYSTSGKLFQK